MSWQEFLSRFIVAMWLFEGASLSRIPSLLTQFFSQLSLLSLEWRASKIRIQVRQGPISETKLIKHLRTQERSQTKMLKKSDYNDQLGVNSFIKMPDTRLGSDKPSIIH